MKTWIKRTLAGLLGVSLIVGGGIAACSHRYGHGWHGGTPEQQAAFKADVVGRVASKLDLDAAQKARLDTLADALLAQRNALVGTTTNPRAELRSLMGGASFDRARAQALLKEKTDALETRAPTVVDALADFYDSLRPEQQQDLRDRIDGRRGWWRG